jgi:hypothetical protein
VSHGVAVSSSSSIAVPLPVPADHDISQPPGPRVHVLPAGVIEPIQTPLAATPTPTPAVREEGITSSAHSLGSLSGGRSFGYVLGFMSLLTKPSFITSPFIVFFIMSTT